MRFVACSTVSSTSEQNSLLSIPSAPAIPASRGSRGAGRGAILRAPTLFEDAVKVLATTNCTWGLTKVMVTKPDRALRERRRVPAARVRRRALRAPRCEKLKLGYRAPYLAAFADRVASGALDLSRWEDPARPDADVEKEIRAEKGFGPYAADTLGRLLGRHGKLGLDSWSRKKVVRRCGSAGARSPTRASRGSTRRSAPTRASRSGST